MSEWISVKDRLPEPGEKFKDFLTIDVEGTIDVCCYEQDVWYGWQITHWMLLPEPPKEGE